MGIQLCVVLSDEYNTKTNFTRIIIEFSYLSERTHILFSLLFLDNSKISKLITVKFHIFISTCYLLRSFSYLSSWFLGLKMCVGTVTDLTLGTRSVKRRNLESRVLTFCLSKLIKELLL